MKHIIKDCCLFATYIIKLFDDEGSFNECNEAADTNDHKEEQREVRRPLELNLRVHLVIRLAPDPAQGILF